MSFIRISSKGAGSRLLHLHLPPAYLSGSVLRKLLFAEEVKGRSLHKRFLLVQIFHSTKLNTAFPNSSRNKLSKNKEIACHNRDERAFLYNLLFKRITSRTGENCAYQNYNIRKKVHPQTTLTANVLFCEYDRLIVFVRLQLLPN